MVSESDVQDLLGKLDEEREALIATLVGMTETEAEYRPPDATHGEDGWSVKEQLAHLAEMETTYRAWVQRATVEDHPDLTRGTIRENVTYPLEIAERQTVAAHIHELASQRERTLALLDRLTLEEFGRMAHSSFGELSVLQLLRSFYRHDRMHRDQILRREPEYRPRWLNGEPDQRRRV